jgi:hypothetical protein
MGNRVPNILASRRWKYTAIAAKFSWLSSHSQGTAAAVPTCSEAGIDGRRLMAVRVRLVGPEATTVPSCSLTNSGVNITVSCRPTEAAKGNWAVQGQF